MTVLWRDIELQAETNALDYLERAKAADEKWVIIALHGCSTVLRFALARALTHNVTYETKRGNRRLISFGEALEACQDPKRMRMTV